MSPDRITAGREFAWLTDRAEHRKPIDAFFEGAAQEIERGADVMVLELGPGPLTDLRDRLRGVKLYARADTRPADAGVRPLEPKWSDTQRLPYRNGTFNHVLAREVFEHVFHLREMIAEVHRVLADDGMLWFSTPFMYLLHDVEPENGGDFWRLSPPGWERLLSEVGFAQVRIETARNLWDSWQCPISVLGWARK